MLAASAVLGAVAGLSLAGSSSALAANGGDGYNGMFLSEVFTHGTGTADDVVAHGDWIELHNTTGAAVDFTGAILSDSDNTHSLVLPSGTSIPANGFMSFRTDGLSAGGTGFSLGDQDEARLFAPGSEVATTQAADEFDWGHSPVFSWSRDFDDPQFAGDPEDVPSQASAAVTQDADNKVGAPTGADPLSGVKINEVNMNGGAHGDWIELFDDAATGSGQVNLKGAILSDNDDAHAYVIGEQTGDTTSLLPGQFAGYRVDDPAVNGNFGLGNGDAARLFSAANLDLYGNSTTPSVVTAPGLRAGAPPVDSVQWATAPAFTLGRVPDGDGAANDDTAFTATTGATFDASNGTGAPPTHHDLTGVVINAIKTTGDPAHGDWIELLNSNASGTANVDLSQAILSDNNDNHQIRIKDGTMLAPGATLTITTDNDTNAVQPVDPNVASGRLRPGRRRRGAPVRRRRDGPGGGRHRRQRSGRLVLVDRPRADELGPQDGRRPEQPR